MALFANANRGKNQKAFTPQDFWKLSYDKESQGEAPQSLEEFERIVKKFGKRRKKK